MRRRKLAEIVAAKRKDSELARHETWTPERLAEYQRTRIDAIVRHAVASSGFYRERFGGLVPETGHVDLKTLPALDKETFVERFDEIVTDPALRRDELLAHVESADAMCSTTTATG